MAVDYPPAELLKMESILRAIAQAPIFNGAAAHWNNRQIQVTPRVADFKITRHLALVHPGWAIDVMKVDPLGAVRALFAAAMAYEQRVEAERAAKEARLLDGLRSAIEAARAAGREDLIARAHEAQRPVPRSRALVWRSHG